MKHLAIGSDTKKTLSHGEIGFLVCALSVFAIDQISKRAVMASMALGETAPVFPGFFHLTFIHNTGASFGILQDKTVFFMIMSSLIICLMCLIVFFRKGVGKINKVLLGLITGGALGNLADRARYGAVVDFLDFRGIWAYIFNVADMAVICGGVLLTIAIILDERKTGSRKPKH